MNKNLMERLVNVQSSINNIDITLFFGGQDWENLKTLLIDLATELERLEVAYEELREDR